jgi:hypothetical protein
MLITKNLKVICLMLVLCSVTAKGVLLASDEMFNPNNQLQIVPSANGGYTAIYTDESGEIVATSTTMDPSTVAKSTGIKGSDVNNTNVPDGQVVNGDMGGNPI